MKQDEIIEALSKLIRLENTITEDVFYNAGVIDCIKEVQNLACKKGIEK